MASRSPGVFRILLAADDLPASRRFYEKLLGTKARSVALGRIYLDAGTVILGLLDYSSRAGAPRPRPEEAVYFATGTLDEVYRRARRLRCLSEELLHDDPASPMGEIRVRPWGERSFYAVDPSGNPLCFVDERTLFTGTPDQVRALRTPPRRRPVSSFP